MLTPKERALRAFSLKNTDRVPVGIFLGGSWPITSSGLSLEELIGDPIKTAQTFYEVNKDFDADIIMVGAGATALVIRALGGEVRFNSKGAPAILSALIKAEEDLGSLAAVTAINDPAVNWIIETASCLSELVADERLLLASGRAPFTLAAQLYGMDAFLKALYKNKRFAHKLLEFTTDLSTQYFKNMLDKGHVHGAFIADPTASGDVISKKHFEEFVFPYLKRVIGAIKAAGKPTMLHICGNICDRLNLIPDTGVDCLSVETKVDIKKAKSIIGNRVCLAGNIDPVEILQFGSKTDVCSAVNDCMEQVAEDGGFILLPGCDIAEGVAAENIRAFVDAAHQWGIK